jgi:hypothetical protein
LLIVGIVIIASPNTREEDIKEYNSVVAAYTITDSNDWSSGTIAGVSTSLQTESVTIKGNDEDVEPASSRYARASVSSPSGSVSYSITSITPFTRTVSYSQSRTKSGDCQQSNCYNGNGVSCPSGSSWSGPSQCDRGSCGTCSYTAYVKTYCVAVQKSGSTWSFDSSTKCFYKDDAQFQATNPSSVTFQVRQSGDPYIALQRITKGDDDFGITRAQQTTTGVVMIVFGCIMIAGVCVVAFIVYKLVKKFIVKDDEAGPPDSQQYHNSNQNNNGGGGYGQSQSPSFNNQGYGQPVNGHVVQPTSGGGYGYGQPPPPPPPQQYPQQPPPAPYYPQQPQPGYYPNQADTNNYGSKV